ncbi:hypothetical protein PROFUN_12289 [Planoprotostelium fungivorum]|uniref:Uncharacterized protein n=1 Tax=Planoprotostelium fungivorum TaxID=1890364 RepID=A0A2P6N7S2_9EUKA|nr:hypothetical protein PROFUN_12289 [Planoprotostelium fungivorum]
MVKAVIFEPKTGHEESFGLIATEYAFFSRFSLSMSILLNNELK